MTCRLVSEHCFSMSYEMPSSPGEEPLFVQKTHEKQSCKLIIQVPEDAFPLVLMGPSLALDGLSWVKVCGTVSAAPLSQIAIHSLLSLSQASSLPG